MGSEIGIGREAGGVFFLAAGGGEMVTWVKNNVRVCTIERYVLKTLPRWVYGKNKRT